MVKYRKGLSFGTKGNDEMRRAERRKVEIDHFKHFDNQNVFCDYLLCYLLLIKCTWLAG